MGNWTNTAYIHADSPSVGNSVIHLFEAEGMRLIPRPVQRERLWYEPMQYQTGARNNLWGVAVFPGAQGWTVIKSAPLELFAEFSTREQRPRLASLCDALKTPGLMLNVYD